MRWCGVEPPTKFLKRKLDRISIFRGGYWERGGNLFFIFYIKNTLKFEIFKKSLIKRKFNNWNWEILTKNLVTFKRSDGVIEKKL